MMAGVDLVNVSYRGSAVVRADLLGRTGADDVRRRAGIAALHQERPDPARLPSRSEKRLEVLPDVPAMAEFLPGYEASGWYGVAAPKDTPPEIVERLNKEINASITDPATRTRLAELGCLVSPGTPADLAKLVAGDIEKWGKVMRAAGIKPE